MKKWYLALLVWSLWGFLGLQTASAQIGSYSPPQTNPQPAFSPYLNMMRNNPAVNYYGIVRPQMDTARALQQLQYGQQFSQPGMNPLGVADPNNQNNFIITGHPVTFMNLSHYFPLPGSRFAGLGGGSSGSSSGRTIYNTQSPLGYPRR
jgi:hypothetical protein